MKRIISIVCALVFLITASVVAVPAASSAGETLDFVLTNAAGVANDEITVEFQITQNPGFWGFWFFLYYDADTFILKDYTLNSDLKAEGDLVQSKNAITAEELSGPIAKRVINYFPNYGVDASDKYLKILYFEKGTYDSDVTFTGTAITFTFQIMGIADDGEYEIGLIPDPYSVINYNGEDVPFTWQNALIAVGDTTAPEVPPEDDAPVKTPEDTNAPLPEDTGTPVGTDTSSGGNDTSNNSGDTTGKKPGSLIVDTFVDEDGTTYYVDSDGESQVFDEDAMTDPALYAPETETPETFVGEDGTTYYVDSDGETQVYDKNASGSTGNTGKKDLTALYIVIAVVLVLIAAAGVLFVFITKTKKDDGSAEVEKLNADAADDTETTDEVSEEASVTETENSDDSESDE